MLQQVVTSYEVPSWADSTSQSAVKVNQASRESQDIILWNILLISVMETCNCAHDTSNTDFLSYSIETSRLSQFKNLMGYIMPPGDMVILIIINPEEQYSYIHIIHETIAMGFLRGQHIGQRNNYYSRKHPHGFHKI